MTPSSEATPRPWRTYVGDTYKASRTHIIWAPTEKAKIGGCLPIATVLIVSDGGIPICELEAIGREREAIATAEANAAFILAAVNSYDESRKLLREAAERILAIRHKSVCSCADCIQSDDLRIRITAHLEAGK